MVLQLRKSSNKELRNKTKKKKWLSDVKCVFYSILLSIIYSHFFFHFGLDSNFIHASDLRIIEMVATVLSDTAAQLQGNKENLSMN